MRRVLVVSHRRLEYGGTMRWRQLADDLPAHGWEVVPVTPPPSLTADESSPDPRVARLSAVRARVMGAVGAIARPVANRLGFQPEAFPPSTVWALTGRRAVRDAVREHAPAIVVATSPPPAALFAATVVHGVPLVADLRDPWAGNPFYDHGGRLLTVLERPVLARAAAIVVVTAGMLDDLRTLHPELAPRMRMLPNGFHPRLLELRNGGAPPDGEGRRARLIHPGTLYGERTLSDVIAAASAPDLRERVSLHLLGTVDPATRAAVAAAPRELEIEFTPPRPWEDTIAAMRASDVVVVVQPASVGDAIAWPAKSLEALALGRPILAVTSGGALEKLLVELGQPQGCARHGDIASIRAALLRLLEAPPAPVAPERLEPWDRRRMAAHYAALLDELAW